MKASVAAAFLPFTIPLEGKVSWMYCDIRGLVTTGIGNLIDPVTAALRLPWKLKDGSPAGTMAILNAWTTVKKRTDLCLRGGGAYNGLTDVHLDEAGISALVQSRLNMNEATLKQHYPHYDSWPADAQLGLLSMAWAMGPAFNFPKFSTAANACPPNWVEAANQCHMSNGSPARNAANVKLFLAASTSTDPEVLHYP